MKKVVLLFSLVTLANAVLWGIPAKTGNNWRKVDGRADGSWSDEAHWTLGMPGAAHYAYFPGGLGSYTVTFPKGDVEIATSFRANVAEGENEYVIELINPEIIETAGEQTGPEGCLSVPGVFGLVTRPEYVKVRAQDRFGEFFEVEGTGLTARCFCHEIDHLNGRLFVEVADHIMDDEEMRAYYGAGEDE